MEYANIYFWCIYRENEKGGNGAKCKEEKWAIIGESV